MPSSRFTTSRELDVSCLPRSRVEKLMRDLGSPIKGTAAGALAELRELEVAGLPELLRERLKPDDDRFFVPRSAMGVPENRIAWDRRLELLQAVAAQRAPEFVPVLAGQVGDPDPTLSKSALAGLRGTEGEEARHGLIALLKHSDWRIRRDAAAALAHRRETANLPLFIQLLDHRDKEIQRQAALGLGRLDCKEAREALVERFRWAADARSLWLSRLQNWILRLSVSGVLIWGCFDASRGSMRIRLFVLLAAAVFVLIRRRRNRQRHYLAQSLAAQCQKEVPEEIVALLPEMSTVQSGLWETDAKTVALLGRITRAAKTQVRERGDLPVVAPAGSWGRKPQLPVVAPDPSAEHQGGHS